MSKGNVRENPGRARTALVRMGLRFAGVKWEDSDDEDGELYGMRAIPWRKWEAYAAAIFVGMFVACGSIWALGALVTSGGIWFWLLLPLAVLLGFVGLQLLMFGGALLVSMVRGIDEVKWVGGVVLLGLTAAAVGMCWAGGISGWVVGMLWLVPAGLNGVAWCVELVAGE